jgi:hypothetical protein
LNTYPRPDTGSPRCGSCHRTTERSARPRQPYTPGVLFPRANRQRAGEWRSLLLVVQGEHQIPAGLDCLCARAEPVSRKGILRRDGPVAGRCRANPSRAARRREVRGVAIMWADRPAKRRGVPRLDRRRGGPWSPQGAATGARAPRSARRGSSRSPLGRSRQAHPRSGPSQATTVNSSVKAANCGCYTRSSSAAPCTNSSGGPSPTCS